jgi:transposase
MARMSHWYPQELQERAVRLVADSREEYESEWKAIESVATKLWIGSIETLRKWVRKAEVEAGQRPGVMTQEWVAVRTSQSVPRPTPRAPTRGGGPAEMPARRCSARPHRPASQSEARRGVPRSGCPGDACPT